MPSARPPAPAALALALFAAGACREGSDGGAGQGGAGAAAGNGGVGGGTGGGGSGGTKGGPFSGEHTDPSAPAEAKGAFGGGAASDLAARPVLVYPLAGAMLGRNLGGMNVQWKAGAGNTIFRVTVMGDGGAAQMYAGAAACPGGKCQLPVPNDFWSKIAVANAGAAVTLTVEGVAASGAPIGRSEATSLSFTPDNIRGGLYYWSTLLPGTMRVALGASKPEAFLGPGSPASPHNCVGCHTVTRDGCKVAFSDAGGDTGKFGMVDGRDPGNLLAPVGTYDSNFQAFSPDGKQVFTLKHGELVLRGGDGTEILRVARSLIGPVGEDGASQPEWSPDGKTVAFTRMLKAAAGSYDYTIAGDIALLPAAGGKFDAPATVLVTHSDTEAHYYPSFSPDSKWIVFNSGTLPGKSPIPARGGALSSYDQKSARLRLMSAAGGAPLELAAATHGVDITASWPKFSPFAQNGGSVFFIVFSSRIDYGFVVEQAGIKPQPPGLFGRPQLWVAAVDVARKGDPSYPPFWLSFQDSAQGNHLGYWTTNIVGKTIGSGCE